MLDRDRLEYELDTCGDETFEDLATEFLLKEGYDVRPTESSGADGGVDAILIDDGRQGFAHFTASKKGKYKSKHESDGEKSFINSNEFEFGVFVTNQAPRGATVQELEAGFWEDYGWDTRFITRRELITKLSTRYPYIAKNNLQQVGETKDNSEDLEAKAAELVESRRTLIAENEQLPVVLRDGPTVQVHVIPLDNSRPTPEIGTRLQNLPDYIAPFGKPMIPLEAEKTGKTAFMVSERVGFGFSGEQSRLAPDYVTIHRDGWFEGVSTQLIMNQGNEKLIDGKRLDAEIALTINSARDVFDQANNPKSLYVSVGLIGIKGALLGSDIYSRGRPTPFSQDQYEDHTVVDPGKEIEKQLRSLFNGIWREAGWSQRESPHYNENNEWNPLVYFVDH